MQAFLQGVQRAGADVAEHHPDRTEDERGSARTNRRASRRSGFDRICHIATGRMHQNDPSGHITHVAGRKQDDANQQNDAGRPPRVEQTLGLVGLLPPSN
jgi:hypothetical protein